MFDYYGTDTREYAFDVTGTNIQSDLFACCLRDDLRLLLALGDSVDSAVERILNHTELSIGKLDEYTAPYYSRMRYIYLAYYLERNGYYHADVFKKAIGYIEDESVLYPFKDAIVYEKNGAEPISDILCKLFKENAGEMAALLVDDPSLAYAEIKPSGAPSIITEILFLNKSAVKKLEMRTKELNRVKEVLLLRKSPTKKPTVSSVLYNAGDDRYYTNFSEGDVVAYRIGSGKLKGKYVLLLTDYLCQYARISCDSERLVRHCEEFVVYDCLYEEIPNVLPAPVFKALKEVDGHVYMHIECFFGKKEYKKFSYTAVGKAEPPQFERFYRTPFSRYECGKSVYNIADLDGLLNELFDL